MKDNGFQTAAVIGGFVLSSHFGLDQGFQIFDDDFESAERDLSIERRGEVISRAAVEWLDEHREGKQFLFLHYFDPHADYRPPEPFRTRFAENPYDGELAYTDWCIGKVIEKLDSLGVYDSSLVVITADHGEALGEHGETTHAYFVYQSTVRVPLLIKPPGSHEARRIADAASLIDVMPTILDAVGIPSPGGIQGRSLTPHFSGNGITEQKQYHYFESLLATKYDCSPLIGVSDGRWKLIETAKPELYDLAQDPSETRNRISDELGEAQRLRAQLEEITKAPNRTSSRKNTAALDESTRRRLRALGYLSEGDIKESSEPSDELEDPKDFLRDYLAIKEAETLYDRNQYSEAKAICSDLLSQRPDMAQAMSVMGSISFAEGDLEKAVEYFEKTLQLRPDSAENHLDLGVVLAQMGSMSESLSHLSEAVRLDPNSGAAHNNLGNVLASLGRARSAIEHFQKALDINPTYADAHLNMGIALGMESRYDEATAHCRTALDLRPGWAAAEQHLRRLEQIRTKRPTRR
jgi:tetratricopeptide (TPR) repeat protein